jgi:hypothetical protein
MNKIADPDDIVQIYALGRQLQAKESSISQQRTKHREKLQRDFVQHAKKTAPRSSGKILAKKPRSKITARKARRSL